MRSYLVSLRGAPGPGFALALAGLRGRVLLALPRTLLIAGPEGLRERLAGLPGVLHAGEVTLPARPVPRLRVTADGRPAPAAPVSA